MDTQPLRNRPAYTLDRETAHAMWLVGTLWLIQVLLSLSTDFENFRFFKPAPSHEKSVNAMFDQVIAWGGALKTLRGEAMNY